MRLVSLIACLTLAASPAGERKGVQARKTAPDRAPRHGLLYESFGLVNETFSIAVDFHSENLQLSVKRSAKDGSGDVLVRTLTGTEVAELLAAREKTWREWVETPRKPASEYQEYLWLLDGDAVTVLRGDDGFRTNRLTERLKALAQKP